MEQETRGESDLKSLHDGKDNDDDLGFEPSPEVQSYPMNGMQPKALTNARFEKMLATLRCESGDDNVQLYVLQKLPISADDKIKLAFEIMGPAPIFSEKRRRAESVDPDQPGGATLDALDDGHADLKRFKMEDSGPPQ